MVIDQGHKRLRLVFQTSKRGTGQHAVPIQLEGVAHRVVWLVVCSAPVLLGMGGIGCELQGLIGGHTRHAFL
jgi:hypothetical protein